MQRALVWQSAYSAHCALLFADVAPESLFTQPFILVVKSLKHLVAHCEIAPFATWAQIVDVVGQSPTHRDNMINWSGVVFVAVGARCSVDGNKHVPLVAPLQARLRVYSYMIHRLQRCIKMGSKRARSLTPLFYHTRERATTNYALIFIPLASYPAYSVVRGIVAICHAAHPPTRSRSPTSAHQSRATAHQ